MGKLHELLAVESDLKATAQRTFNRVENLFTEGKGHLVGQIRHYVPLEDGGESFADEVDDLSTTADCELHHLAEDFTGWIDAAIQKEVTNQKTSADVIIGEGVLLQGLPATALLNLESKIAEIRKVYARIPTNDPGEQWVWDDQQGIYKSEPRISYRTQKVMRNHVLAEATKEHPAQVQVYTEDKRVGTWTTTKFSGMLTTVEKQKRLNRIDVLARAVKAARQRANDVEVEDVHIGEKVFAWINGD